mmetsp:Transcript_5646/g.22867  ORF Transcript_5646/g.22867 Transcript_5646/m.22867 type:complete len:346 (-) Transcript_5646:828-1865(-)
MGGIDPGGYPKIPTHSSGVASRTLRRATPNHDATARRSTRSDPRSINSAGVKVTAFGREEKFSARWADGAPSAAATATADRDPADRSARRCASAPPLITTPMLLTTASTGTSGPSAAAVSFAVGPVSGGSRIGVGSTPSGARQAANAAAVSDGESGATYPSPSTKSSDASSARVVPLVERGPVSNSNAANSSSKKSSATRRAPSRRRKKSSASIAGTAGTACRSRAISAASSIVSAPRTRRKSRTKTRASCAAYRVCAKLSGLRFQSEHVTVLSRGAPRKCAAAAERPGSRGRPAFWQTADDAHSVCRHTAFGIAASARPSDAGQDFAARRRSSASPNPSTTGGS